MEPSLTEPLLPRSSELRRIQLRSRRLVTGDLLGQYRSAFRGTGLVYTDIREYLPGDDVKHIHWKATARTSKVFVKSYEEDRQLRVLLAVDASASMRSLHKTSAYMKALEFASTVGALTQQGNDLFGLSLFGDTPLTYLPPKSGGKRTHQILAALMDTATFPKSGQTNIAAALSQISLTNRKPSIIFVLSDFFCPSYEQELRTLASMHDVVLVQIESSINHVGELGLVTFADAETGEQVVIDTSNKQVRDAWNEHAAKHRAAVREIARSCRADHIVINDNALRPLVRLMKERTRRISR